jgi:hypothetical protein
MLTIPMEQSRAAVVGPSAPTAPFLPGNPFASARVTAAGEETGLALMGLGNQTRRLSRDMLLLAARAGEQKDALLVNEKIASLAQYSLELEKTLQENFPGGLAIGNVTRQGLQNYDNAVADLSGQLEKPRQKELFARHAQSMRLLFSKDLARHETGQQALHQEAVTQSTRNSYLEKARLLGQSGDPDSFENLLPVFDELIARQFAGFIPDEAQREFESLARRQFMEALSLADPQRAAGLLDRPTLTGQGWSAIQESLGSRAVIWRHTLDNLTVQGIENRAKEDQLHKEYAANAKAENIHYKLTLHLQDTALTGQTPREARQFIDDLSALGGHHAKDAQAWASRFSYSMEIWSNLAGSRNRPFAERFERLEKLKPKKDDPHFEDKNAAYLAFAFQLEAASEFFQTDPAGYAQRLLEVQQGAKEFAALPQVTRIQQIFDLQKTLGRGEPLVLSADHKEFFWHNFNQGDAQTRAELLTGLKEYKHYQHQVCQELGLPPTYSLAATVDRYLAKSIVAAYDAAVKGFGRRAFELAHQSWPPAPGFWDTNKMGGILSLIANKTSNSQYTVMANDYYLAFAELTLQTGSSERAEDVMFQHIDLVSQKDILIGWIPTREINRSKEDILNFLGQQKITAANKLAQDPTKKDEAGRIMADSFFVPSARGDSFVLIHPDSKTAFTLPNEDKPFEVTFKELRRIIPANNY